MLIMLAFFLSCSDDEKENKLQIESYQKILPIPRIELDRDPSIKQNPGYKL